MLYKSLLAHGKFKFSFWNFLEFFPPNIFNPQLVESADEEPLDMESQLYAKMLHMVPVIVVIFFFLLICTSTMNMHSSPNNKKFIKDEQTFQRWEI